MSKLWKGPIRRSKRMILARNPTIRILQPLKSLQPPNLTASMLTMYPIDNVLTGIENLNHLLNHAWTQVAFAIWIVRRFRPHTQWRLEPTSTPTSVIPQNIRVKKTYRHWTPFSTMFTLKTRSKASSPTNKSIIKNRFHRIHQYTIDWSRLWLFLECLTMTSQCTKATIRHQKICPMSKFYSFPAS